MNLLIVSTYTSAQGAKKPINALFDRSGAAVLFNYDAEKTLRWTRARFQPLHTGARLDQTINCSVPGKLIFLTDFQAVYPSPYTLFGLTLDTAPADIFKAVIEQIAFYFYFHATNNFDIQPGITVAIAGALFRYNSLCRILANLFNLTVVRLGIEREKTAEDETALYSKGLIPVNSIQLNSSIKHTDTIFEPVKNSHALFRDAYYRYLKVGDDVSAYLHALKA